MKLNYLTLYYLLLTLIGLPLLKLSVHAAHHGNLDPAGTWKIEITASNGQTYYPEATFTSEADGLKGSYYSPVSSETFDLEDASFEAAGDLKFTLNNPQLIVKYAGKISGNTMKGTANIENQGQSGDVPFSATREVIEAATNVVGTWNLKTSIDGSTYEPTASIRKEAGELAGLYTTGYTGQTIEIESITLEDNQLSFTTSNSNLTLNFRGAIESDSISGTMSISAPQGSMDGSFTGMRNSD
jgi:hypothetical protein